MSISPKISLITPCYNSEKTLEKTLQSIFDQNFEEWEVLIVNDGSTDGTEEIALKWVQKDPRFKYFYKENGGLGKARNYGIERAKGTYILPLDSDNLIEKDFAKKAMRIFDKDVNVGVVHGYAEYFGEKEGLWIVDDFNLQQILVHNYIDACAIFRKTLWEMVGGYDENMPFQGHEDWEFWISLANVKTTFFNLHQVTFKYFVSNTSMIHSFTNNMVFLNQDYIVKKHSLLFHKEYKKNVQQLEWQRMDHLRKLKSRKFALDLFLKTFFRLSIFKSFKNTRK